MSNTPEHVISAIHTIAVWLREQQYGCAIVDSSGGASFHQRSVFDEKAELFAQITTLEERVTLLREALDAITRMPVGAFDNDFGDTEPCDRCGEVHDIARAALEPQQ